MKNNRVNGYKGFSKGLICQGKQYAENTVFEEAEASITEKGLTFYPNPFDVLASYPLLDVYGEPNEFAEVEALGEIATKDHKEFATTKLKIGRRLPVAAFVKACVDYAENGSSVNLKKSDAILASSGDGAKFASSGDDAVIMCAGANSTAKAKKGSWITLAEWGFSSSKGRRKPLCVKTMQVDGTIVKEDTWYTLTNGKFVEV